MKVSDISELSIGQLYAAHVDGVWYRAVVLAVPGSGVQPSAFVRVNNFGSHLIHLSMN